MKTKYDAARAQAVVRCDTHNHHVLEIRRGDNRVTFIPMPDEGGVELVEEMPAIFDQQYKDVLTEVTPEDAAKLFLDMASYRGITRLALEALGTLVPVTLKEKEVPVVEKTKAAAPVRVKGISAASRFRELIMAGEMTDDQIFATVKKEFGLDPSKRGYVQWYRSDLKKKGNNPPAAK